MSNNEVIKKQLSHLLIKSYYEEKDSSYLIYELIKNHDHKKLRFLINSENFNINKRDNKTRNALYWAIKFSNDFAFDLLVSKNIDLIIQKKYDLHALHFSVYEDKLTYVKKLLNLGVDINLTDTLSANALYYSILYKHYDLMNFLLNNNANILQEDIFGNTPLKEAIKNNIYSALK